MDLVYQSSPLVVDGAYKTGTRSLPNVFGRDADMQMAQIVALSTLHSLHTE